MELGETQTSMLSSSDPITPKAAANGLPTSTIFADPVEAGELVAAELAVVLGEAVVVAAVVAVAEVVATLLDAEALPEAVVANVGTLA